MYFSFQQRQSPKAQCCDCWTGHVVRTGLIQSNTAGRAWNSLREVWASSRWNNSSSSEGFGLVLMRWPDSFSGLCAVQGAGWTSWGGRWEGSTSFRSVQGTLCTDLTASFMMLLPTCNHLIKVVTATSSWIYFFCDSFHKDVPNKYLWSLNCQSLLHSSVLIQHQTLGMSIGAEAHKYPPLLFLFWFSSPANPSLKLLIVTSLTKVRLLVCIKHCLQHWPTLSHSFLALLPLSVAVCRQLWSSHTLLTAPVLLLFVSPVSLEKLGAESWCAHGAPRSWWRWWSFTACLCGRRGCPGCSIVYSHKTSEVNHLSLPLQQEWEQADLSSLPFDVEITSSGTMSTEISPCPMLHVHCVQK